MNRSESVANTVKYGRKLVTAGLSGIRTAQPAALNGRSISTMFAEAARGSAKIAAAGACVGLLRSYLMHRRGRPSNTFAYGILGTAIGLCAGLSWRSREVARGLAHSALREMQKTSDEHWLESHPIDYA